MFNKGRNTVIIFYLVCTIFGGRNIFPYKRGYESAFDKIGHTNMNFKFRAKVGPNLANNQSLVSHCPELESRWTHVKNMSNSILVIL